MLHQSIRIDDKESRALSSPGECPVNTVQYLKMRLPHAFTDMFKIRTIILYQGTFGFTVQASVVGMGTDELAFEDSHDVGLLKGFL